jgi:hypothetical protein
MFVGKAGEDFHDCLCKSSIRKRSGRKFRRSLAVRSVAAGEALNIFRQEIALGGGDVAEKIAEGESAGSAGLVDFVARDAMSNAEGAFAHVAEILEEGSESLTR